MSRLQVMSDLHFEFHADHGSSFVRALDPTGVDALILAGDITTGGRLADALEQFCERYPRVFYVIGNHELYGYSRAEVGAAIERAAGRHANLHVLDGNAVYALGDRRVVGCALWFPYDGDNERHERLLNDFAYIPGFRGWVYEVNREHQAHLRATVRAGDIVVTHHLPSEGSVTPRFLGSPLNRFFVCPMDDVMKRRPALWVHGHTHASLDYVHASGTRVVCNPFGYAGTEPNSHFDAGKIVDV